MISNGCPSPFYTPHPGETAADIEGPHLPDHWGYQWIDGGLALVFWRQTSTFVYSPSSPEESFINASKVQSAAKPAVPRFRRCPHALFSIEQNTVSRNFHPGA
jgi:hypothetical protein